MNNRKIITLALLTSFMFSCTTETTKVTEAENQPAMVNGGKPSAPISMQYKVLTQSPQVGEEIEIQVNFNSRIKSAVMVEMTSAKKLTWLNTNKTWQNSFNKSGSRETSPNIKVIGNEVGVFHINLIASIEENGSVVSKPFTIAVQVGNGERQLETVGEVMTDSKGQKVIVQKAKQGSN